MCILATCSSLRLEAVSISVQLALLDHLYWTLLDSFLSLVFRTPPSLILYLICTQQCVPIKYHFQNCYLFTVSDTLKVLWWVNEEEKLFSSCVEKSQHGLSLLVIDILIVLVFVFRIVSPDYILYNTSCKTISCLFLAIPVDVNVNVSLASQQKDTFNVCLSRRIIRH